MLRKCHGRFVRKIYQSVQLQQNQHRNPLYVNTEERKMLRRLISAIIIMLIATPILMSNIMPARCTAILSQNFDDEPTGSTPQGWTTENSTICSLTVNDTVYYGSSGKSARYADMASYPGGKAYVGRTFEDQYGSLVFSVAMRAENPDYFSLYVDDGYVYGANIYFIPEAHALGYFDGEYHTICPFSVNTWYQIRLEIDIPTNLYDIYVDGSLRARDAHFRGFGLTTHLNTIEFGCNSYEEPVGFIDDLSLVTKEQPVTPVIKLTGSLDYLLAEDAKVRLDALVQDAKTMAPVSNASVNMQIYYSNGSLWVSDLMTENLAGTGIYEWESTGTIREMNLDKGVYLVYANASTASASSTDILLFHVDPSPGTESTSITFEQYSVFLIVLIAGTIIITLLLGRRRKLLLRTSRAQIDTL
jgi:hypothetical protein